MSTPGKTAVLLLAHGSPESVEEVPDFLLRVTGGRPLPPDAVEEVKRRIKSPETLPSGSSSRMPGSTWTAMCFGPT